MQGMPADPIRFRCEHQFLRQNGPHERSKDWGILLKRGGFYWGEESEPAFSASKRADFTASCDILYQKYQFRIN